MSYKILTHNTIGFDVAAYKQGVKNGFIENFDFKEVTTLKF